MGIPFSKYAHPNDLVRVYGANQRPGLGTTPKGYMTREDAREAVRRNFAVPCVKGFAIHLRPDPEQRFKKWNRITIRGQSCQMGPRVTQLAADDSEPGCGRAREAAESYLMIWAGSYCPLVLKLD